MIHLRCCRHLLIVFRSALPSYLTKPEIGRAWVASAKIARKAAYVQTAYSANLQASQWLTPYAYIESCKSLHHGGQNLRALQELDYRLKLVGDSVPEPNTNVAAYEAQDRKLKAKVHFLRQCVLSSKLTSLPGPSFTSSLDARIRALQYGRDRRSI